MRIVIVVPPIIRRRVPADVVVEDVDHDKSAGPPAAPMSIVAIG